jgi:hypothetical protein
LSDFQLKCYANLVNSPSQFTSTNPITIPNPFHAGADNNKPANSQQKSNRSPRRKKKPQEVTKLKIASA